MSAQERKERERSQRHSLIVSTARELAEAEGWDAVTTRRLAERIEYSQPVLYGHFRGKNEIVAAVALEGFTAMSVALRGAAPTDGTPHEAVAALAHAYVAFAEQRPAVYDAMFRLSTELRFADAETPKPLSEAFAVLVDTLSAVAGSIEPDLFAEVVWAALHGLVTLTRAGRLPPQRMASRIDVLVKRLVGE